MLFANVENSHDLSLTARLEFPTYCDTQMFLCPRLEYIQDYYNIEVLEFSLIIYCVYNSIFKIVWVLPWLCGKS